MSDRVQVIKWESPASGGTQTDTVPTEINPNEDGLDARSLFLQNDSSADSTVEISRDASNNMTFQDGVVSGTKTLADLLSGSDDDQVKIIVPTGETFIVKEDYQHIVFGELTIDGEYRVIGESVILGAAEEYAENLRRLLYYIDDGPVEGFSSAYKEVTGTIFPTSVIWYTDSGKTEKIVEKNITWNGVVPSEIEWVLYDTDGGTALVTVTDAITYTSTIFESSRARTIAVA